MIENIFSNPENVKEVNETLITLIPKVDQVTRIRDFRPISLCNVLQSNHENSSFETQGDDGKTS